MVRRRPGRDRTTARPHRVARCERRLPDTDLPGGLDPPLRREQLRARRSAPRRRRGACVACARRRRSPNQAGRRPDAQPHGPRPRMVQGCAEPIRAPASTASTTSTSRCRTATPRGSACPRSLSSTGEATSCAAAWRTSSRTGSQPGSRAGAIDVANMTGRYKGDRPEPRRRPLDPLAGRRRARPRRARARLQTRSRWHGLARRDELRRLPEADLVVAPRRHARERRLLGGAGAQIRRSRTGRA